jgi:LPXTG-motif cell wall-anchored protein
MALDPERSTNDPRPKARTGDSSFLPVVIISGIVILLILIGSIFFFKSKKEKAVPLHDSPHKTSQIVQYPSSVQPA